MGVTSGWIRGQKFPFHTYMAMCKQGMGGKMDRKGREKRDGRRGKGDREGKSSS